MESSLFYYFCFQYFLPYGDPDVLLVSVDIKTARCHARIIKEFNKYLPDWQFNSRCICSCVFFCTFLFEFLLCVLVCVGEGGGGVVPVPSYHVCQPGGG